MAEIVRQLEQNRTSAKSTFTKQANYLSREMSSMTKQQLQEEFSKLKPWRGESTTQMRTTYKAGLLADLGAKEDGDEDVELDQRQ